MTTSSFFLLLGYYLFLKSDHEAHLEDFPLPVDFLAAALLTLQLGVHGLPLAVTFLNNDHTAEQIHIYPFDEDYLQDRD
jgi:hypothetical protein